MRLMPSQSRRGQKATETQAREAEDTVSQENSFAFEGE